jgi:hypothetical protein
MSESTQVGKTGKRSPWGNRTITRRLHGVEYELFEDSDDIYDYVNTEVRRELEADQANMGRDPRVDPNVSSLSRRKWKLEILDVSNIRLNPLILDSIDVRTGRKFTERIAERRAELRQVFERGGARIWPLVTIGDERLLVDGYCRHSTLSEMRIPEAYSYVGRIVEKTTRHLCF